MNTEWRACVPNYEVSDAGRVRRTTPGRRTFAGRILKPQSHQCGYLAVRPTINGKNVIFYVHDLVAAAFIGQKPEGLSVNHIDANKHNNNAANLEYVTHAANMAHAALHGCMVRGSSHPAARLTERVVRQVRADRAAGMSYSKLAKEHGIAMSHAFQIVHRKVWSHIE